MKLILEIEVDITKEELSSEEQTMLLVEAAQNSVGSNIEVLGIQGMIPVHVMKVHLL